jgi:hypothetical protein
MIHQRPSFGISKAFQSNKNSFYSLFLAPDMGFGLRKDEPFPGPAPFYSLPSAKLYDLSSVWPSRTLGGTLHNVLPSESLMVGRGQSRAQGGL